MEIREIIGNVTATPAPDPILGACTYLVDVVLKENEDSVELKYISNLDGRQLQKNDVLLDTDGNIAVVTEVHTEYAEYEFKIAAASGGSGEGGGSGGDVVLPDDFEEEFDSIKEQLANTKEVAEQAKAIANDTKKELEENIQEVLDSIEDTRTEIQNAKDELNTTKDEIQASINQTKEEIDATVDTFQEDIEAAEKSIEEATTKVESLVEDMDKIVSWKSKDGLKSGVAGFVSRADENDVTLAELAVWKDLTNEALTSISQTVESNKAYITQVTKVQTANTEAITSIQQTATDKYAQIDIIAKKADDNTEAISGIQTTIDENNTAVLAAIAKVETDYTNAVGGLRTEVSENYVANDTLANFKTENSEAIAGVKEYADRTFATLEQIAEWGDPNAPDSAALAALKLHVEQNYATIDALTNVNNNFTEFKSTVEEDYATNEMVAGKVDGAIASFKQEVESDFAKQETVTALENNFTSYKQEVTNTYATQNMVTDVEGSLAEFEQEVEKDYAKQSMVTNVENALTSFKQEVKDADYAKTSALTTLRTETTEAIAASEATATAKYVSKTDFASFQTENTNAIAAVEKKADDNSAAIQDVVSWVDEEGASLVTFKQEAGDKFASATQVAQIVDKDGNIKEAAIVTAVNNNLSEINLTADHINFEGSQFSSSMTSAINNAKEAAINDAVAEADTNTDEKLKNYSTTEQTKTLIKQTTDGIDLSVYSTKTEVAAAKEEAISAAGTNADTKLKNYSTKNDTATAKTEAINAANSSTDTKLKSYSTTSQMNTALALKADSATLASYAKTTEVDSKLSSYAKATDMNSALALKADSATLKSYAKTTEVNSALEDALEDYAKTSEMESALSLKADSATLKSYAKTTEVNSALEDYASEMKSALSLKADSADLSVYATTDDVKDEIEKVEAKIALEIKTDEAGKKYACLNANADTIKFDATNTIEINATNFTLDKDGKIVAISGEIGGWELSAVGLEKKPGSYKKDSVTYKYGGFGMRTAHSGIEVGEDPLLAIGWEDGEYWADSPFCVYADGRIKATSGTIGGFILKDNKLLSNQTKSELNYTTAGGVYISTDGIAIGHYLAQGTDGNYYYPGVVIDASTGKLTANNIEATGGTIGGFTIRNNAISSGQKTTSMEVANVNSKYYPGIYLGPLGFSVHSETTYSDGTSSICYYGVTVDATTGKLMANNAEIEGKIIAREGTIGGFTISTNSISTGTAGTSTYVYLGTTVKSTTINGNTGSMCFVLGTNFGITKAGKMYANSGYIGPWEIASTYIRANFTGYTQGNYSDSYAGTIQLGRSGLLLNDTDQSWYTHIRPRGTTFYSPKKSGASGYKNLAKWLDISSSSIEFTLGTSGDITDVGSIHFGRGTETSVVGEQVTTDERNFVISSGGTSLTGYLLGNWTFNKTPAVLSDSNYKNTIMDFAEEYDVFFDALHPRTYKYNYGNSGRTHFGFIAQEVVHSATNANIDLQNVAAVCQPDTESGSWRIRYEEFISLNTWQIQMLKARVTELENKIAQLTNNS